MAQGFYFRFFSLLLFERKKNLSPNFGMMVFLDLVDFQSTGSWDFSSLFFDKRPLDVGLHVLINLKLIDMAFGCDVR